MAARKSFEADMNPMEQSILRSVAPEAAPPGPPPPGHRVNPYYIENKTRRLYLIIPPSAFERLKARADRDKISINRLVYMYIEAGLKNNE